MTSSVSRHLTIKSSMVMRHQSVIVNSNRYIIIIIISTLYTSKTITWQAIYQCQTTHCHVTLTHHDDMTHVSHHVCDKPLSVMSVVVVKCCRFHIWLKASKHSNQCDMHASITFYIYTQFNEFSTTFKYHVMFTNVNDRQSNIKLA